MADPSASSEDPQAQSPPPPAIVLVEPQLADNIGAVARAMLNCGLDDLRLVNPRDGWPNPRAVPMASGAGHVLDAARRFDDVPTAIGDLHRVYATTARRRDMIKHTLTPRGLATELRAHAARGERCGILFGRERIGLTNEEVALADALVTVPLNPAFSSLNLGQAVLLIAYQWFQADDETPDRRLVEADSRAATRDELHHLFVHLERDLEETGFFRIEDMRPVLWRKIRSFLLRAELTEQDVRLLHGMLAAYRGHRKR